jgi:hypothetical protein
MSDCPAVVSSNSNSPASCRGNSMREEYLSQVENLDNMRNLHAVKYGKIKKSSGDVWDDLKAATEEAWSELEFY